MRKFGALKKLALFIVTVMVFVSVGTWNNVENAYAADSDWTISTNDTGVTVVRYNGSSTNVTIPSTINGSKVTQIGNESYSIFYRKETTIKSVTLPAQGVVLNKNAFNGCSNLTTVNNSSYATLIGVGCFAGCKSLTSFSFSNSITVLGDSAFRNTGLKEVTLPSSVKSLRLYVFGNCSSLKKVTVLNSSLDYKDNTIFSGTSGVTLYAASGSTTQSKAGALGCSFAVYSGSSSGGSSSGGSSGSSSSGGSSGSSSGSGSSASGGSSSCDHNWVFKSLKQSATCVQEKADNQKCSKCGATRVFTYSGTKIAHKMSDYRVVVSPSATRDGYKVATCSMCGYEERITLPAYGSSGSGSSGDASGGSSSSGGSSGSGNTSGDSGSGSGGSGSSGDSGSSDGSTSSGSSGNASGSGNSSSGGTSGGSSSSGNSGSGSTSGGSSGGSGNSGNGSNSGNSGDSSNGGGNGDVQQSTGSQLSGVENLINPTETKTEPVKQIPLPLIIGVVVVVLGIGYFVIRKRQ